MTKGETLAYIAGIIDGEGYLGISKAKGTSGNITYYARITVHMNKSEGIEVLCKFFNVPIKSSLIGGKPYFSFYLTETEQIISAINILLPYLKVKAESARIVLELAESRKNHKTKPVFVNGHFRGSSSIPSPIQDYRASLYQRLKQIQGYGSKLPLKT